MKISWLEQLVKEGHVRPEARDVIYRDCGSILKLALDPSVVAKHEAEAAQFLEKNKFLILGAGGFLSKMLIDRVARGRAITNTVKSVQQTRQIVLSHSDFAAYKEKAEARFTELAKLAPTIVSNPELTLRIIQDKLHSGFTANDVQSLALIQAAYTPNMGAQMRLSEHVKKASQRRLGETYATIIGMLKEATAPTGGFNKKLFKVLGRAAENAAILSTIPILGGVGVGAIKHVSDIKDRKEMGKKLNDAFDKAVGMDDPDRGGLRENKERARQAFEVLTHFAPHVALQPAAAHAYMKKIVSYGEHGGPELEQIKMMSDIQKNYKKTSPFFEGLGIGTKALGLEHGLKSQIGAVAAPMEKEISDLTASSM